MDDESLKGRVSGHLLTSLGPASDAEPADVQYASIVAGLVGLILDERAWEIALGTHLPGLWIDAGDSIPPDRLSSRARTALRLLDVATWGELAQVTPGRVMELPNIGVQTLADVVEAAATQALSALRPPVPADQMTEVNAGSGVGAGEGGRGAESPGTVGPVLEMLAAWAEREGVATTLSELVAAIGSAPDVPPDIRVAWDSIARSAVSAIARHPAGNDSLVQLFDEILGELEERQRTIFVERCLSPRSCTLQELADRLGITRERVRQLQGKVETQVADLLAKDRFAPLRWRAYTLRSTLGPSVPEDSEVLSSALARASLPDPQDPEGLLGRLLLRLGGYTERGGWMIRDDATMVSAEELEQAANEHGLIDVARVDALLNAAGVAPNDYEALLRRISGFRRFGDRIAIWKGSVADKAVRVLAVLGRPATPEELAEIIGEGHAIRSLRNRLYGDSRLMRVSKNAWALRAWRMEEYTGVADEIAEEIERQGGRAALPHLVELLTSRFGIAEGSVRAYSQTPRFVVEDGMVRIRRQDESYQVSDSIADAKGCFQDSPTGVTFCVKVDEEVLRGSGRPLPSAVAAFVGLVPGIEIRLQVEPEGGEHASVMLTWPADSVVGPTLGSIRLLAAREGADEGDILRLRFDRARGTVQAVRITASQLLAVPALEHLSLVSGLQLDSNGAVDRIAESLGVSREIVRRVLYTRGDSDLVHLLPQPAVSADLQAALAELEDALVRDE